MPFSQIIPPSPFPTESKRLFYSSVSLWLSCIQGYHYHLSKLHMFTVTLNCIPSLQHWIHRLGLLPLPPTVPIFSSLQFSSIQFSHSVVSDSLWPHEMQHARPPCPSPTPGVHSDSRPSSPWCHPAISSSVVSFSSCPQSLPASESFPMSQLFTWGGQSTGVSALASFLPKKSQGWTLSEWTGWIS